MAKIIVNKAVNTALLVEQLEAAYNRKDYLFWLQQVADELSITPPDDVDPVIAETVLANHDGAALSTSTKLRNQVVSIAASAEGVALTALTAAQVRALMAVMLFKMGGIDPATMTVKALKDWA